MNKKLRTNHIFILLAIALSACQQDDALTDVNSTPSDKGQVMVTIREKATRPATRGETGNWLDPVGNNELINNYWVVFAKEGTVAELVSKRIEPAEQDTFVFTLDPGTYTVYGFANLTDQQWSDLGIAKGAPLPNLSTKTIATTNNWKDLDLPLPMTSKMGGQNVTVVTDENQTFAVEVVRTMAKLQLDFTNNTVQPFEILGYEIYPLERTNVSLLEPATPSQIVNNDTIAWPVSLATPLSLSPNGGNGSTWLYVNETNATASAVTNQYSLRFKVRRNGQYEEYRYGFTVNHTTIDDDGTTGFTYIRRNDWIKIPITFCDWIFRIEALPFPPIAGFQSRVVTADALSITFNTGGYIVLHPAFRKNSDTAGMWRSFDDSSVVFSMGDGNWVTGDDGRYAECIDSETGTGMTMEGDLNIFEDKFFQLPSGDIIGQLTNDDNQYGEVTITMKVLLEGFAYQFVYTIIKQR